MSQQPIRTLTTYSSSLDFSLIDIKNSQERATCNEVLMIQRKQPFSKVQLFIIDILLKTSHMKRFLLESDKLQLHIQIYLTQVNILYLISQNAKLVLYFLEDVLHFYFYSSIYLLYLLVIRVHSLIVLPYFFFSLQHKTIKDYNVLHHFLFVVLHYLFNHTFSIFYLKPLQNSRKLLQNIMLSHHNIIFLIFLHFHLLLLLPFFLIRLQFDPFITQHEGKVFIQCQFSMFFRLKLDDCLTILYQQFQWSHLPLQEFIQCDRTMVLK